MPRTRDWRLLLAIILIAGTQLVLAGAASAAAPVVKVVPWVATNPLIPHDTYPAKAIRLKGTTDATATQYYWDYGDGSAVQPWTNVTNRYVLEAVHTYTGATGTVFTARLYVRNAGNEVAFKEYYVAMRAQSLSVEVNIAIDEGLWYLHKAQYRFSSSGVDYGIWDRNVGYGSYAALGYYAITPANVNAFEVNGHLESGDPMNPYTETVARGMKQVFALLAASAVPATRTFPVLGTYSPDGNANGYAVYPNQYPQFYQGGMFVDAIIATGTPNAVVSTGPANIIGRTYKNIVQDMVDGYAYCVYNGASAYGGWRYSCGDFPDNSPSQWGAIAIIPAVREWGVIVDPKVMTANLNWLTYSYYDSGSFAGFGYTGANYYPWGPYATTPSGMVQMVMDGIGRGNSMWDRVETTMRNNFGNSGGATVAVKDYYYGLFSFVKSLLLHNPPIQMLHSSNPAYPDIDWYAAEVSKGAPTDGVARTLVGDQNSAGYWYGHNYDSNQYPFETAWAIIMLNRTVFTGGAPVAVARVIPNPAVAGQLVTLDGSASFHQDAAKSIVQWDWDINNDGVFELHGPVVTYSWPLGSYPVTLKVTDNVGTATAETTTTVLVTIPPLAPTPDAGGPYNFCLAPIGVPQPPFFLDGSKSVNPDEGQSEAGQPPDTIYGNPNQFSWNLGTAFGDAYGIKPNVTEYFTGKGVGNYLIQLRVTDTTATSFPSSGQPNLAGTASGQVFVRASTDPICAGCITNLAALSKNKTVQLTWALLPGAHHYNVYRGSIAGGPYVLIGSAISTQTVYFDFTVTNGLTYYYVVRPAALNGAESCQSNEVIGRPRALR